MNLSKTDDSILYLYYNLTDINPETRIKTSHQLVSTLLSFQSQYSPSQTASQDSPLAECCPDVVYALKRLLRGLPSSRDAARQGFTLALTPLLEKIPSLTLETILLLLTDLTAINGNHKGQEEKELKLGRLFGYHACLVLVAKESTTLKDIENLTQGIMDCMDKRYLTQSSTHLLIEMLTRVQENQHIKEAATEHIIRKALEQGISSPDTLWFTVSAQAIFPDLAIWKDLLADFHGFMLHRKNLDVIVEILKNTSDNAPQLHSVWKPILHTVLVERVKKSITIDQLWPRLDEIMFTTTHERKCIGFQAFQAILSLLNANQVPLIFTPHFMRCLINSLSKKDAYLHKHAVATAKFLSDLANEKPEISLPLVMQLIGKYGNVKFDQITKTKTVDTIVSNLTSEQLDTYLKQLSDSFFNPSLLLPSSVESKDDDTETAGVARIDNLRKWILEQMALIVRTRTLEKTQDIIMNILKFVITNGFFEKKNETPEIRLSDTVRNALVDKLISLIGTLSTVVLKDADGAKRPGEMLDGTQWITYATNMIRSLRLDDSYEMVVSIEEDASDAVDTCLKMADKIQKKMAIVSKNDVQSVEEEQCFLNLFLNVMLGIFAGSIESSVVQDLVECHKLLFATKTTKSKKRKAEPTIVEAGDLDPVQVLMDILISFMSKPSAILRSLACQTFKVFVPKINNQSVTLILDVLDAKAGAEGEMQIGDEMEVDEEESDDEIDESDDEEAGPQESDIVLETKLKQLAQTVEHVDVDELPPLNDEDMEEFDSKLAEIFRAKEEIKTVQRDTKQSILHFKLRALDLIEVLYKYSSPTPIVLETVMPMLKYVFSTAKSSDESVLHTRLVSLLSNRLCKSKEVAFEGVERTKIVELMNEVHSYAKKAADTKIASLCSSLSIYLVKVYLHLPALPSAKKVKKDSEENELDAVAQVYYDSFLSFINEKKSKIKLGLFSDLCNRYPQLAAQLLPKLLASIKSESNADKLPMKSYPLVQTVELISLIFKSVRDLETKVLTVCIQLLSESFQAILSTEINHPATEGPFAVNKDRLRDLLKYLVAIVRKSKKQIPAETFGQLWGSDTILSLMEQLVVSERFKEVVSLKSIINEFKKLFA